ncbi:MAG: hypothetical protein P8H38_02165 [Flavobacteriaceae bacterium]|jgi:hypothetical protein|nr:hypothetical protein [Flavobacteriaceae bacterium]|tara:strand:+ start:1239 stop:1439 length:201 start_codon:yes stop_codon:yes gene_type:complete
MKNSIIIAASVLVGCFILGILISNGISTDRYEYVSENVVFDKKTGTTYFTDKKEYRDTKGDLYRYD